MRRRLLFVGLLAMMVGCGSSAPSYPPATASPPAPPPPIPIGVAASELTSAAVPTGVIVHDANAFTFDLLHRAAPAKGNFLVSGYAARHAIGALAAASPKREATLKALDYPAGVDQPGRAERNAWMNATSHLMFTSGARIFYDERSVLSKEYAKQAVDRFDETFTALDFAAHPETARHQMGQWVSETTGGQLSGDVSESAIPKDTTVAIAAAFGLQAPWERPFSIASTKDAPFAGAPRGKRVKMMQQITSTGFTQMDDGTKLVEMPLGVQVENPEGLSVLFVLPPKGKTLHDVEKRLDRALYDSWESKLEVQKVRIELPRFKVKSEFDLTPYAGELDTSHVFENGSPAHVRLDHTVTVTVDEGGIKAAASTVGVTAGAPRAKAAPIPDFIANRPFLFFIHDRASKSKPILLAGRIENPAE